MVDGEDPSDQVDLDAVHALHERRATTQIGALARAARCSVATVRYYEQAGLLPEPARTEGNFRGYEPTHLERLRTIRGCRALDLSLDEIRELLAQADGSTSDCAGIDRVISDHLNHVDEEIRALEQLRAHLEKLGARCRGAGRSEAGGRRWVNGSAALRCGRRG